MAAVVRRRDTIAVLVRGARFRQHYSGWPISLTGVLWAHHHLVFSQTFCESPSIWDIVHRMPPRFVQKPLFPEGEVTGYYTFAICLRSFITSRVSYQSACIFTREHHSLAPLLLSSHPDAHADLSTYTLLSINPNVWH